jgi:Na+/H+ antiporter NhaD/arsenite permease-like protein
MDVRKSLFCSRILPRWTALFGAVLLAVGISGRAHGRGQTGTITTRMPALGYAAGQTSSTTSVEHMGQEDGLRELGRRLPVWTVLPFVGLLLSIAILPLVVPHWWEHNVNRLIVAAGFSLPVAVYLLASWGHWGWEALLEKVEEYISFIALLAVLFIITGGVLLEGSLSGTPLVNTCMLAVGCLLANVIGTTGAAMLLVRPLLRANASRRRKVHVFIFLIFTCSNCAGLLTPLADPPLFLGFINGVPFEWTFRLIPEWLFVNGVLLALFNLWDQWALSKEEAERLGAQLEEVLQHEPLRIRGWHNAGYLLAVVATIYASGRGLGNGGQPWPFGYREAVFGALAVLAWITTPSDNRVQNRFTFGPILEVAILFAGIFVTMAPALLILNAWGQGLRDVLGVRFGLTEPWQFFWATGLLSSFLDNAPTYLTFAATACGLEGINLERLYLQHLVQTPDGKRLLEAISCGAVFMGANTYIGNAPNFMVRSIAAENGVPMPSFFGYMLYSGTILLPLFAVVTYLFFLG